MEKVNKFFGRNWENFANLCQKDIENLSNESLITFRDYLLRKEYEKVESIASCVFLTGVNNPDLDFFISNVSKTVNDVCNGYFASTHGLNSINNARTLIEKLIEQLSIEGDSQMYSTVQKSLFGLNQNIKSDSNLKSGPIVFMISDLDGITNETLNDFIDICTNYRICESHLKPLVLAFCISTTLEISLTSRLNSSTSSRMDIVLFQTPSPMVFVNTVVEKMMAYCGMKLNANSLIYLIDDLMLCLDYSVKNLLRRIKFIFLKTIFKYPQYIYITCGDLEKTKFYFNSLSGREFQCLLRSFTSLNELTNDSEFIKECTRDDKESIKSPDRIKSPQTRRTLSQPVSCNLLTSSSLIESKLTEHIENNWRLQIRVPIVIQWLYRISQNSSMSKQTSISDLYLSWLEGKLAQTKFLVENIFPSFNNISDEDLKRNLNDSYEFLKFSRLMKNIIALNNEEKTNSYLRNLLVADWNSQDPDLHSLSSLIQKSKYFIQKFSEQNDNAMETDGKHPSNFNPKVMVNPVKMPVNRKMSMKSLKEQLDEMKISCTKTSVNSPKNALLEEIKIFLQEIFKTDPKSLLPPFKVHGFHEAFYPANKKDLDEIKSNINPDFQATIHRDLVCEKFKNSDFSIMYKLHTEFTGTYVNLNDWLYAFNAMVDNENGKMSQIEYEENKENISDNQTEDEDDDDTREATIDSKIKPIVIMRFFNALATLNHIGLIKMSKERKDVINRVTWNIGV